MSSKVVKLSNETILDLSEAIALTNMTSIAAYYFGMEFEKIDNLKTKHRGDVEEINKEILQWWMRKNQECNQYEVLGDILSLAAAEKSLVDPYKMAQILDCGPNEDDQEMNK